MAGSRVWPRYFVDRQSVVNVVPIIRRRVGCIDAESLNDIDHLQDTFDLRPTGQSQQALPTRRDPGHGRVRLSRCRRAQDIDAGQDGPEIVRRPTDESEDAAAPGSPPRQLGMVFANHMPIEGREAGGGVFAGGWEFRAKRKSTKADAILEA